MFGGSDTVESWPEIAVRLAGSVDLDRLVGALGQRAYFAERLAFQQQGRGLLLVAWQGANPVGDVYLKLEDHTEELLRDELAGLPLLTHLEVLPHLRNRGIGTALLRHSETELGRLGYPMVTLGVHPDNTGAIRLYRRDGYRAFPEENRIIKTIRYWWDEAGKRHEEVEECVVFVKDLAVPPLDTAGHIASR
jgi:GNAT superfamily N-acetyltransferase